MHGGTDPHYSLVNLLGVLEPSLGLDLIDPRSSYLPTLYILFPMVTCLGWNMIPTQASQAPHLTSSR